MQRQPDGGIDGLYGFVFGATKHGGTYALPGIFANNHEVPGDVSGKGFNLEVKFGGMAFGHALMKEDIGRFIVAIAGYDVLVVTTAGVTGEHTSAGILIDILLDVMAEICAQESDVAIHNGEPIVGVWEALKFAVVGKG